MFVLRAETLSLPRIVHGFFGRQGGVSDGIYASLNCGPGSDDDRAKVIENRRRVMAALGANLQLATLYQIHSAEVVPVTAAWNIGEAPQADAMVTNVPGIALGVLTADCAPVLFADARACVIGAAHAGWKGAQGGIIEATVEAMEKLGAVRGRIAAAIGPCISQASYEVDDEFRRGFLRADSANARFFVPNSREGYFRFDLEGYVAFRLDDAGVANVEPLGACTYARADNFYSFRRATHAGEKDYGREISAIALTL
ncbi:MAG: peptidoglycan editing factor PgeF [Alphaproteobacteria bacterium]|nr:peptidoglycan editing factor PgeF [Alphaproteobacteria bacterium]MDE2110034.1 peptidoglycan editing factor PgeF [Alphaproteobacteria bacterium]MDE2492966.1 peptidoglycan editing factor PgeF [Alphaproteobacteria bacterium]